MGAPIFKILTHSSMRLHISFREKIFMFNQLITFLFIEYLNEYENLFEESKNLCHANDADFRRLMEVLLKFRMEKGHYNKDCLEINKLILTNSYEYLPMLNTAMKELTVAMLCNVLNMYEEAEFHINKAGLLILLYLFKLFYTFKISLAVFFLQKICTNSLLAVITRL